jgi:hypothetical protein
MQRLQPLSLATVILGMALSATAALAQPYPHPPGPPGPPPGPGFNHPPGPPPGPPPQGGPGWHQWHQGDHYHGNRYVVNNWQHYRLRPPPPGYQWVQDGSQFVLIAVASGIIADVILNAAAH